MHKVSRTLLLAGVLAFGTLAAACGDKVTVQGGGGTTTTPPTGVTAISLTPPAATIAINETIQLAVSVTADAATAKTVTYSSSNAAVASVDATGRVTGRAAGTATIVATSTADASKAAATAITVSPAPQGPQTGSTSVSISTINQFGQPAQLGNIRGQVDVTSFVTAPAGSELRLYLSPRAQCGNAAINPATDIVVARTTTTSTAAAPVTLSFNTSDIAVSGNPVFANGDFCIKTAIFANATSTTALATAANSVPLSLNNASFFRVTSVSFRKTTDRGDASGISPLNGNLYNQGDLTVTFAPVNFGNSIGQQATNPSGAPTTSPLSQLNVTLGTGTNFGFAGCAGVMRTQTLVPNTAVAGQAQSFTATFFADTIPLANNQAQDAARCAKSIFQFATDPRIGGGGVPGVVGDPLIISAIADVNG